MGSRFDLGHSTASAEMIYGVERASPGVLRVSVLLPSVMPEGPATLQTVLDYSCNKVHALWPIKVTTEMPFRVLP